MPPVREVGESGREGSQDWVSSRGEFSAVVSSSAAGRGRRGKESYPQVSSRSMHRLQAGVVLSHFLFERVHWMQALRWRMRRRSTGGIIAACCRGWISGKNGVWW